MAPQFSVTQPAVAQAGRLRGCRRPLALRGGLLLIASAAVSLAASTCAHNLGFALLPSAAWSPAPPKAAPASNGRDSPSLRAAQSADGAPQGRSTLLGAVGGFIATALALGVRHRPRRGRHAGPPRGQTWPQGRSKVGLAVSPDTFEGVCEQTGVTLSRYLLEITKHGIIDSDLLYVFNSIREATKVIANLVSTAPLRQTELLGLQGGQNVQGEDQKKLDVITNEIFKRALKYTGKLGTLASEEEDAPMGGFNSSDHLPMPVANPNKYVCVFDPLDGSSNVDASIAVGTIFGVFTAPSMEDCDLPDDLTQMTAEQARRLAGTLAPGKTLVASGYVLYSSSTEFVLTCGRGVVGFTLDTSIGEFVLTRPHIVIPSRGHIYSMNEANISNWDPPMQEYIKDIKRGRGESGECYSLRYIGSMVGDIHRTLLYGGIFAYPADKKNKDGKLRLLYEAAPMSMILEQAGGMSISGYRRCLDIPPVKVHQRVPIILGSRDDVAECQKYYLNSTHPEMKRQREEAGLIQ